MKKFKNIFYNLKEVLVTSVVKTKLQKCKQRSIEVSVYKCVLIIFYLKSHISLKIQPLPTKRPLF